VEYGCIILRRCGGMFGRRMGGRARIGCDGVSGRGVGRVSRMSIRRPGKCG
jgi:hypothetical protein